MGNEEAADKKFTWVIKNFSSLESACLTIHSDEFVIAGCKWRLMAYPKGFQNASHLSLYLMVATRKTLPCGWRRHVKFRLTVVNQLSGLLSQQRDKEQWFDQNVTLSGNHKMLLLTKLYAKKSGFLVNDGVKITAEVDVLEVIGELDVSDASKIVIHPPKRIKLNDHGASVKESINVYGFQVLPSQAESVKRILERHPDMTLEFRVKNQHMRTSCINLLLNIIETLCQALQDFSFDDLSQAKKALTYLKDSGFKVDWLERKVEDVKKKKMEEQFGKTRMQELEKELKVFKQKCSDIEALLEKEKEELNNLKLKCSETEALLGKETKVLAAARAAPLTLDDFF
ncbi:PREDICTED: MATH domain and coiled-coil domain-containing protein At3g44790-like [Camelina sativa]|uniref:MATH domain and coiled-coil domain-containing protein At3g44790-like n=1 Tax=Camelina sativa TaxID=90675 RepID=A0ABM0YX24_CAMSA|nr:PREDICTED: MATH domain and coiled-coil domain-containing protein At3g44790-like [Camelina sativa]